jgi:hypothetical protein
MSTDPALPDILSTAAGRVDRVAEQLSSTATAIKSAGTQALFSWSGPSAASYSKACAAVAVRLDGQAAQTTSLAGALRRAAKSASQRIYYEKLAEEAERRRREAAAAAAAAQRKAGK